jgi:hypothetical protein
MKSSPFATLVFQRSGLFAIKHAHLSVGVARAGHGICWHGILDACDVGRRQIDVERTQRLGQQSCPIIPGDEPTSLSSTSNALASRKIGERIIMNTNVQQSHRRPYHASPRYRMRSG